MLLSFATGNRYKFSEVKSYLEKALPDIRLQQLEVEIPEIQESDAEKVLRAKIEYLIGQTENAFVVDDVSFLTERYKGFPGPYAKFINGTLGYEGWKRLFDEGDPIKAIALIGMRHNGAYHIFKGELEGVLSSEKGIPENSYAPLNDIIFLPELNCFLGEALKDDNFKNHRIQALDKLVGFIRAEQRQVGAKND